jgi:endonuclease YncB( thermonuclease family)
MDAFRRRERKRPPERGAGRTAVLLAAFLASASPAAAQAPSPSPEIVAPAARDVTPPGITPGPSGEGPLTREAVPPPPPDPPRWRRFFLPKTTDAATFKVEQRTIRIAGVTVPTRDEICGGAGGEWPCGRTALYSLRMFLRGRAIECFYPHADTAVEITAPCRVGETDLGLWLLEQGWAKPGDYATDEYRAAAAEARCKGRGLWRGTKPDAACPAPAQQ